MFDKDEKSFIKYEEHHAQAGVLDKAQRGSELSTSTRLPAEAM